jgi:hypothetical protein
VARRLYHPQVRRCGPRWSNWRRRHRITIGPLFWHAFFLAHKTSRFLGNIRDAFKKHPDLPNLLLDDFFAKAITGCQESWRRVVAESALHGIPTPAFSTALAFYDGYR